MVDLAQLRDARPEALIAAGDAYNKVAKALGQHIDRLDSQVVRHLFDSRWVGTAAGAANQSMVETSNRLKAAREEIRGVGVLLQEAADAFFLAQSKIQEALQEAHSAGFTVEDDGTVSFPPRQATGGHDPDWDSPTRARVLADRLAHAVTEADVADLRVSRLLDQLALRARDGSALDGNQADTDLDSVKALGDQLTAYGFPPGNASPTEVNSWWNGLTEAEQNRLIHDHPDLVGNSDGIPTIARDQANRLMLKRYIAEYSAKQPLSEQGRKKLIGFRAIQARLLRDAGQTPPEFLYGLSDQGQGRGILSFGNPDTADNVSAYVPGLGTELKDVGGKDGQRALYVWQAAHRADPSRSTASMVWLGYDPPPGVDALDPRTGLVMSEGRAEAGAASYDHFMAGLRATHQGQPAHLVALGHSYGSLTVGLAGQRPGGTGADDIILIGSPGTGASHASQLGVGSEHVWVGAAEHDPVTHLPSKKEAVGAAAPNLPGIGAFVGHQLGPHELWFRTDPASVDFGANRFDVATGPVGFSSHSNYLDPSGGNSLSNIGKIVTGNTQNVVTQTPR